MYLGFIRNIVATCIKTHSVKSSISFQKPKRGVWTCNSILCFSRNSNKAKLIGMCNRVVGTLNHNYWTMIYYICVILGIFACSLSQLMLKISANQKHNSKITEFVNPWVMLSYAIFFCSLLINIWAMNKGLQLKEMAILEALGYVFVPTLSYLFLKEQISWRTTGGIGMILLGIIVFYI